MQTQGNSQEGLRGIIQGKSASQIRYGAAHDVAQYAAVQQTQKCAQHTVMQHAVTQHTVTQQAAAQQTVYSRIVWKRNDSKELCSLYARLRRFERQYPEDAVLKSSVQALEHRVTQAQQELRAHSISWGKRILLTLGIAFLSACTVRYWINKLEPFIEDYAIRKEVESRTVPSPPQYRLPQPQHHYLPLQRNDNNRKQGLKRSSAYDSGLEGRVGAR